MTKITSFFTLILFSLFTATAGFSQCTDQFLQGTSASFGSGYNWSDAFIASCSGRLEYVQFYSSNSATVSGGSLKVYNGAGVSTTPIYTQSYPAFAVTAGGPMRVDLTGDVNLVAGNQYTFSLYVNGSNIYYYPSFSIYPGGGSWQNGTPSYKHNFKVGIQGVLATENFDASDNVAVFPNPSNGHFDIALGEPKAIAVKVYDVFGKLVFSKAYPMQETCPVDLTGVSRGMYFLKMEDGAKTQTRKIVVE